MSGVQTHVLSEGKDLVEALLSQMSRTIDWRSTVARLRGYNYIIESGPGNSLRAYLEQALPEQKFCLSIHYKTFMRYRKNLI